MRRGFKAVAVSLCLISCARRPAASEPKREAIVSVGGAVTETVFALGAGDAVVGVDTSSVFPDATAKLPKVGYQRTLLAEGVLSLAPTLLLATAEAGPQSALEQVRNAGVRVESVASALTVDEARTRIQQLAKLLKRDPSALLATLNADLAQAHAFVESKPTHPKVLALYARGGNTLLVFGKNTAAASMIALAGGENAVVGFEGVKPLTSESVVAAAPSVILLPSRGLQSLGGIDGVLKLPGVAQTPAGAARSVITIDDLQLLGFGPRTGKAVLELAQALHAQDAVPVAETAPRP